MIKKSKYWHIHNLFTICEICDSFQQINTHDYLCLYTYTHHQPLETQMKNGTMKMVKNCTFLAYPPEVFFSLEYLLMSCHVAHYCRKGI